MPVGKADHIEFDDEMPGFGVRLRGTKGEHRTYIAQYKIGTSTAGLISATLPR
jgi:hypothetical protein